MLSGTSGKHFSSRIFILGQQRHWKSSGKMAFWHTRNALFLMVSHCPPATTMRILESNAVLASPEASFLEDLRVWRGLAMGILEEKWRPEVPERHFTRGFSLSLRVDNEKPRGKVPSGYARKPFYPRIFIVVAGGQ